MKILIIGGVAGGASAAARLRRLDEYAEIVILERGPFISYANCGLPYYIGGAIADKDSLALQTPESFKRRFQIDVRVNHEAVSLNPAAKTVTVRKIGAGTTCEACYEESYDKLILSPGAEPVRPPITGLENSRVFTLRTIPDTERIKEFIEREKPKTAVIAGGGYIGVEMAENLVSAGLKVSIVELADHLIAPLDFDMAADVHQYIKSMGTDLILENGLQQIEQEENGLRLRLQNGVLSAGMLLLAVGVKPESSLAKDCGIRTNARGAIQVNPYMQTSIPDIYAVGDAVETTDFVAKTPAYIPLAGPANKQGRIAADHICGLESSYRGTQGSAVLKLFGMTVATTGLNEKAAETAGLAYDKTYLYSASHAAYYPGASNMSLKLLWEKDSRRLLGAQIVGFDGVDKRMDVLAAAIRFGAKITDLAELELCYAPPFGSARDPVNMAGFVAQNVLSGTMKQFFWDEVDGLPRDGAVTLLDVRTEAEVARGKIDGFKHIPLDSLRQHLEELPLNKPVYVHCHSGLRSYIACRILSQYGFTCYNLAGGYRLYASVTQERKVGEYVCTEV